MPVKTNITNELTSNRVTDALYLYAEQEALLKISRPIDGIKDVRNIQLKYDSYKELYNSVQKNSSRLEKLALLYVKHELDKMHAQLNPTFVNRILYSSIGNRVRNLFNGNNILYKRLNTNIQNIHLSHIRNYNIESLTAQLKELGFSSSMEGILQKMIGQNVEKFHVRYADLRNRTADFVLHFKKLPTTDIYFLEKFDARSTMPLTPKFKKKESCIEHTFHTNEHPVFSAKEAANLVDGKAVCKEIDGKETWMNLNNVAYPQQTTFNKFRFDLSKKLEKLPIKEMNNNAQRNSVLDALKSGNKKEVTLVINEQAMKYNLEISPFNKTVNIMDKDNRLVDLNKLVAGTSNKVIQRLSNLKLQNDEIIFVNEPPSKRRAVS